MKHWNVIVTINQFRFKEAFRLLKSLGRVSHTRFYNVLAMQVEEPANFLETIRELMDGDPETPDTISRVAPVLETFEFDSAESFEREASALLLGHAQELAGRSFHMRVHRRGESAGMTSFAAERRLGHILFEALQATPQPARVSFDDPDVIVCVETLESRAGVALWTRQQRAAYPFLRID
ncbi:MAG: THUMP domain-containing protein [Pirellulaceae bacterium]